MNSVMNRGTTTHQIPALSFSLSTPPEHSPDGESSFIAVGAYASQSAAATRDYSDENETAIDNRTTKGAGNNSSYSSSDPQAKEKGMDNPKMVSVANEFVTEVILKAKEEAYHKNENTVVPKTLDAETMEMVRLFVSDVLVKAKEEAVRNLANKNNQNLKDNNVNNNNVIYTKDKNDISMKLPRQRRAGPWFSRAARFISTIFIRLCPCRTTGEP